MKRFAMIALACAMCLAVFAPVASAADKIPAKAEMVTGKTVHSNEKAKIDASNAAEGYILVSYTGGKNVKIKVQIQKTGGTVYNYNLKNDGTVESFPINAGDGEYAVRVFENIKDDKYAMAYNVTLKVTLRNQYLPFMYSNQYAAFTADSQVVKTAAEITKGLTTDLEKVTKIYEYVINNLTYDNDKAKNVLAGNMGGYLPNVDAVLKDKKGICFDYAALMTAMLRSQGIPCKMAIGYAGETYHAWINVYIEGVGWVDKVVYFDGKDWSLMDPTFISTGKGSKEVQAFVGDGKNYAVKFVY